MESACYGRVLGTELGPMSFADLKHMAQVGELSSDDEIKIGDDGEWVLANSHPDLFVVETNAPGTLKAEQSPERQRYFCQLLGNELGPLEFEDLQQMAINGELSESDSVRLENDDYWKDARDIPGLFNSNSEQVSEESQSGEWYCQVLGSELGPLQLTDLITMIQNGELGGQDMVRCGSVNAWVSADEMEQLRYELMSRQVSEITDGISHDTDDETSEEEYQLAENSGMLNADRLQFDPQPDSAASAQSDAAPLAETESSQIGIEETVNEYSGDEESGSDETVSDELLSDLEDMVNEEIEQFGEEADAEPEPAGLGWFVQGAGNVELGPMSLEQLQTMIEKNQVQAHQKIKSGQAGSWFPCTDLDSFLKSLNITDRLNPAAKPAPVSSQPPAAKTPERKRNLLAPLTEAWTKLIARISFSGSGGAREQKINYLYANPMLLVVLVIAAGIWALQFVSFDVSDEVYYTQLNELYYETRNLQEQSGSPEDWNRLIEKGKSLAENIESGLAKKATAENPAQISILRAARDNLVPMIEAMRKNDRDDVILFEKQLREIRAHLDDDRAYFERQARLSEAGQ